MSKLNVVVFVIFAQLLGASLNHRLSEAEALLHDSPEESMSILQSIPNSSLNTKRHKARYALLMSAALDKNYIDVSSDSLISVAVDYYSRTNDHQSRKLAFYYKGVVLKNASDFATAAVYFEKAIKEARIGPDYRYLGLSNRALANIMNVTNNTSEAINYEKKAISFFKRDSTLRLHELFGYQSLAIDYSNDRQYERAISLLDSLIQLPLPESFRDRCLLVKAEALIEQGNKDYSRQLNIYRSVNPELLSLLDIGYYALVLNNIGMTNSSDYYISKAYLYAQDKVDTAMVKVFRARIENARGNSHQAYSFLSEAVDVQDSLTRAILRQSVSVAQRNYYDKEAQYQELQVNNAHIKIWLICCLCFVIVLVCLGFIRSHVQRKDIIIKEQIAQLAIEKEIVNRTLAEKASILGTLFSERLGHVDRLAENYLHAETLDDKERVFKEYKKKCESFQKDSHLYSDLELDLNKYCDGVMSKLRNEVPSIKGRHLQMITLFFAGLPSIVVQVITGKQSKNAVEIDRSRLRKTIRESGAEHTELFLEMLEVRKTNG